MLRFVSTLNNRGAELLELNESKDILVPDVAACGVVARGLGFIIGASEGWGGGVARCKSSLRRYVPSHLVSTMRLCSTMRLNPTFANNQLVLGTHWVGEDIVRFDHGHRLSICNCIVICSLGRIPWRRREYAVGT